MMPVRLGPLQREHRERVRQILESSDAFSAGEVAVALELFDAALGDAPSPAGVTTAMRASSPDYELLGAWDHGELLGYACFGPTPGTDRTWDLYWIAADAAHRGAGVGSRLLDGVENAIARRGARLLVAETSSREDYDRTRRFYQLHGYGEAARVRDFYAPADHRIMYVKRLVAARPAVHTTLESERGVPR